MVSNQVTNVERICRKGVRVRGCRKYFDNECKIVVKLIMVKRKKSR